MNAPYSVHRGSLSAGSDAHIRIFTYRFHLGFVLPCEMGSIMTVICCRSRSCAGTAHGFGQLSSVILTLYLCIGQDPFWV